MSYSVITGETEFMTSSISSSSLDDRTHCVISEKVAALAAGMYKELEKMIKIYGEESIKSLMSLAITTLESLDLATQEREEQQAELELLKEDREQLLTQWERERQLRRKAEEKYFQLEDVHEDKKAEYEEKIQNLESLLKVLEIKAKNSGDHVIRLEEKENELKKEFSRLHERYTELFKTHCDYMEKTKSICGSEKLDQAAIAALLSKTKETRLFDTTNEVESLSSHDFEQTDTKTIASFEDDTENCSYGDDTCSVCDAADLVGMTKEVDQLILENNELIETKNALNVLKDDLIEKVEELNEQLEIMRDEVNSLQSMKFRMKCRITELEEEVKRLRNEQQQYCANDCIDEDLCDKRFFTRAEMSRVLIEKNTYKQRLLEFEEAVKWQELLRATRSRGFSSSFNKQSRIWQLFSRLFESVHHLSSPISKSYKEVDAVKEMASDIQFLPLEDRQEENDWSISKHSELSGPSVFSNIGLDDTLEQITSACVIPSDSAVDDNAQMWIAGLSNLNVSRIVIVNPFRLDSLSKSFLIQNHSAICLCFVPHIFDYENFGHAECEFCKRNEEISSVFPESDHSQDCYDLCFDSMWIGTQDGCILIHSISNESDKTIHKIKLKDSILSLIYEKGRVFCGMANGSIIVFHRMKDGCWYFSNLHLISLTEPKNSVRAICAVSDEFIWCGVANQIFEIDQSLTVQTAFEVHPRRSSQIRLIVQYKLIAVISIRLDSTLRLFDVNSKQHLIDVDIDPLERSIFSIPVKSGLALVKITAMLVSKSHLWIGTNNGNIICFPVEGLAKNEKRRRKLLLNFTTDQSLFSTRVHCKAVKVLIQSHEDCRNDCLIFSLGQGCKSLSGSVSLNDENRIYIFCWKE